MTKAARGTVLVAATVCALSACNGTLRFDETPLDAGPDRVNELPDSENDLDVPAEGATDASGDAACSDAGSTACGWRMTECQATSDDDTCQWYCAAGLTCTNGACATSCVAECLQNSTCQITTGDVSRAECKAGATCALTLGGGSNAACTAGSSCQVRCTGRCAISCQAGATCQLRCSADADFTTVTGTASCS